MKDIIPAGLYHRDIGLPYIPAKWFDVPKLVWSSHAQREFIADRYFRPSFTAIGSVVFTADQIIEVEVENNEVVKLVVRVPYAVDPTFDIVLALHKPEGAWRRCTVKTVWFNRADDKHSTLDRSKYRTYAIAQA